MKWKRCYGLEDWTFAKDGKMRKRQMSGNDVEIEETGRSASLLESPSPILRASDFQAMCPKCTTYMLTDRWFKDGVDVNEVEISEAHW